MRLELNLGLSSNNQDWGSFGSYIGGVLAPAASLLAGYLVYKSFALNAYQQKLLLIRESLSRLDEQIESKLNIPFKEYPDLSLRDVVYAINNKKLEANENTDMAILALLHNMAILCNSIRYYIGLLKNYPSSENDTEWLGELDRGYWIEKYSAIAKLMVKVVGQDAFDNKVSKEQLESFNFLLAIKNGL
jgi:hypothetical protein